jgi:hypothetical protein
MDSGRIAGVICWAAVLRIGFAFVIFSALLSFGQSQPPSPTPSELGQKKQSNTTEKQAIRRADDKPANPTSTPFNQPESEPQSGQQAQGAKHAEKTAPGSEIDWASLVVAIFTAVLAILAGCQFWAMHRQAEYMRDALEITRKTADAAKLSADIAKRGLEANIAIVSMILRTDVILQNDDETLPHCWVEMTVLNTGQSSARSFCFEHTVFIDGLTDDFVVKPEPTLTSSGDLSPGVPLVRGSPTIDALFPNARNIGWGYVITGGNLTVAGSARWESAFGERMRMDYKAHVDPSRVLSREECILFGFQIESTLKSDAHS